MCGNKDIQVCMEQTEKELLRKINMISENWEQKFLVTNIDTPLNGIQLCIQPFWNPFGSFGWFAIRYIIKCFQTEMNTRN